MTFKYFSVRPGSIRKAGMAKKVATQPSSIAWASCQLSRKIPEFTVAWHQQGTHTQSSLKLKLCTAMKSRHDAASLWARQQLSWERKFSSRATTETRSLDRRKFLVWQAETGADRCQFVKVRNLFDFNSFWNLWISRCWVRRSFNSAICQRNRATRCNHQQRSWRSISIFMPTRPWLERPFRITLSTVWWVERTVPNMFRSSMLPPWSAFERLHSRHTTLQSRRRGSIQLQSRIHDARPADHRLSGQRKMVGTGAEM